MLTVLEVQCSDSSEMIDFQTLNLCMDSVHIDPVRMNLGGAAGSLFTLLFLLDRIKLLSGR